MRPLFSKHSKIIFRRYCAGTLAVLMCVAYAVPIMATCLCCDAMNTQPTFEPKMEEATVPSCHTLAPTSGETEEIATETEEIATETEEISSCHKTTAEVPARPGNSIIISNGCTDDCMTSMQTPAVASPGMVESHSTSSKVHSPVALSELLFINTYNPANSSSAFPHTSTISPIHLSTASVPLRI